MAKYSTGGVSGDSGTTCELCGAETADLRTETVAGAQLQVCSSCAQHSEAAGSDRSGPNTRDEQRERRRRTAQKAAQIDDARKGDPERWQQGTDYEDDPLPYLVSEYGERVAEARQKAGLQPAELAADLGVTEADVVAVEQGRATRAGIGGSLITELEDRLDVRLTEDGSDR